jgi:hypothetical protein
MPRPEYGERISDSGHSVKVIKIDPSGKVLLKEGEGTSPKYPGAGDAFASSNPGYGDRDRGGDRGPRR